MTLYGGMTLSGAASKRKKASSFEHEQATAARPALLLDWYDRHRRRLPWRPLAGERADPYRSGCRKSCCSRPASRRSGRISRNSWRAGRMSTRLAARRSTTCCGCGPGSAIIRARATFMPARSRCCAIMAAFFRIPRKACARCRGSGPTRPPRSPRLPSAAGPCRSTAISSAWCRGCSPSRNRCRRPSR